MPAEMEKKKTIDLLPYHMCQPVVLIHVISWIFSLNFTFLLIIKSKEHGHNFGQNLFFHYKRDIELDHNSLLYL